MEFDWTLFARYAAPILALLVGAALDRYLERRPRVVTFLAHASAVAVQPPNAGAFNVFTHSVVVRNTGRKSALNVRLGHNVLPSFSVYPSVPHQVNPLPAGGFEIVFPSLVPEEQVVINYLYFPPLLWSDVNTYAKSDEGFAKVVHALPSPQAPPWQRRVSRILMALGAAVAVYGVVEIVRMLLQRLGGA